MKNKFLVSFLLFGFGCFSQAIKVETTTYNIPELVTKVLVNKSCISISNISWRTGSNFGSTNGIGHFKNTNPLFPLSTGVILTTGNVLNASGPNTTELNDGNNAWIGDTDLERTLSSAGITMSSTNATVLEFDFVPFSPNFDFSFVFASEEYGNAQCQFSDAFAFLLTNVSTGVTTNLAVVPKTTTPISVITIRESLYNTSCSSENPIFFGHFNGGSNALNSATNFNGETVAMSASSTSLVPNANYHIKLVIADRQDSQSDSAIFLGANSFNVGQNVLGPDLTVADNTALCFNGKHTLTTGLNPSIYSFSWTFNGSKVGGNTPNLAIIQPGIYGLTYSIIATNCNVTTDFINVESFGQIVTPKPIDLYKCKNESSNYTYDLSINGRIVSTPTSLISYHLSLSNANINTNPLANSFTTTTAKLPTTIWIRIEDKTTKCFVTKSFQLNLTLPPIANVPPDISLCESVANANTANFAINQQTAKIMGGQSNVIYEILYYLNAIDANAGTNSINSSIAFSSGNAIIFAKIQNKTDSTCFSVTNFKLNVIPLPIIDQRNNQYVCNSYTLPALDNEGNYYSGPNRGLPMLNVGDVITSDRTIYIYNTTSGTPSCPNESSFLIKIVKSLDVNPTDIIACDQHKLKTTPFGLRYFTLPGGISGGGIELFGGGTISNSGTTTIYTYFSSTDIANPCILEGQYNITIYKTPIINPIANVFECNSYTLPALTVGKYYTYNPITRVYTPATLLITNTTTLYVYATNNICRTPDTIFTVYINTLGLRDINACVSYNLLRAPIGEYRDAPNGGGKIILPGIINMTTTIYTYIAGAACTTDTFTITINAPFLTTPTSEIHCDSYLLPLQTEDANYYTKAGGSTTPGNRQLFPNVDSITVTSTIYIYKQSATLIGCYNEKRWLITINKKPIIDSRANVEQCNSYALSPLTNGLYYDDPNGKNPLVAGTVINSNNRIYIYAVNPNDPNCFSETFFDITINGVVADAIPTKLSYCDSFTFPPLPTPNNFYYDAPGGPSGVGNIIPAGTTVTAATALPNYYIYYETGNRINCSAERSFSLKITTTTVANAVNPMEVCDTFGINDGIFEFDLTSLAIRNQVLNGQTPDDNFSLTFFTSLIESGNANAIPIANPSTYQNDSAFFDTVWIKVFNKSSPNDCFDVVELKLIVNPFPNPQLLPEYFICEDYVTGTLLKPATLDSGISGSNYLFQWTLDGASYGGNTSSITTSQPGIYEIKALNTVTLCSKTTSTKVSRYAPYLEVTYSDAFVYPTFITINVLGLGSGNYQYQLDNLSFQESSQFDNVQSGIHTISVQDKDGQCNPLPVNVVIINYPKYFTPNGDGYNETWNIPHLLSTNPDAQILIFDRYGKFLTQITPASNGWNGQFNGHSLPSDDYWFTVDYGEKGISKIFKSHFTLKR